jgi:aminoglycoside phosphotransferase (APT) family kinase protein
MRAILSELRQAQKHPDRVHLATVLDNIQVGVNELLVREDAVFYRQFMEAGMRLASDAYTLLGIAPATSGTIPNDLEGVLAENAHLVTLLARHPADAAADLTIRLVKWELGLYEKSLQSASDSDDSDAALSRLTGENFARYLAAKRPDWPNLKVISFKLQPGGFSKLTVLVDLEDDANGRHAVVIRAEPQRRMLDLDGMSVASEYPVVRYAWEAGLPVAEPLLLETDTRHLGLQFMVSRRASGKLLGSFVGASVPIGEREVRSVLALIARIANTPVDPRSPLIRVSHLSRWVKHRQLKDNTREFIEYWRDVGARGHSLPSGLLNYAVHWLLENLPVDVGNASLIHGDVGFHNILFHEGEISALLDWENSRVGDPAEDLSMFVPTVSHLFEYETILHWYHEAGGPKVSEWRLRYFDVYMAMKIIVSGQVSLQRVEETPVNNLKLAVFGLRYLHLVGSRIFELIRLAEEARERGSAP